MVIHLRMELKFENTRGKWEVAPIKNKMRETCRRLFVHVQRSPQMQERESLVV